MSKDFIFTGDHYLKGEGGQLIEPFVPFDCTVMWRETLLPRIRRRVMSIPDYRFMLERDHTLADLINACVKRDLAPDPIDKIDGDWYTRPMNAVVELMNSRGTALNSRYALSKDDVEHVSTTIAMARVQAHVLGYIVDETGMDEDELHAALVRVLMVDLEGGADVEEDASEDVIVQPSPAESDDEMKGVETPDEDVEVKTESEPGQDVAVDKEKLSPIAARRVVAKQMRDSGTPIAEIAQALDVSESTVQRDLSS